MTNKDGRSMIYKEIMDEKEGKFGLKEKTVRKLWPKACFKDHVQRAMKMALEARDPLIAKYFIKEDKEHYANCQS